MRLLTSLLMAALAIGNAVQRARAERRAGLRTDWMVTLVAAGASIVLALVLLGAVLLGLETGHEIVGVVAGVAAFTGGMVALGMWAARRRRRAAG